MAVVINAKGTSVPYFRIGKSGTTLFQGSIDPVTSGHTVSANDIWFDSANGTVKFRVGSTWSGITTASDLTVTGNLTVQGTTTTVDSTTIQVQNSLKFEGSTSNDYETNLTVVNPTADRTLTLPDATDTILGRATTDTLSNKSIALSSNTLSGTLAQFNTALSSDSFVSLTGTETLTNKTLTSPVLNGTEMTTTGAIVMPVGTTEQRPSTAVVGMMRFNSDIGYFEGHNGITWVKLGHTLPVGDTRNLGTIAERQFVGEINYGLITDTDTSSYSHDRGLITDADER